MGERSWAGPPLADGLAPVAPAAEQRELDAAILVVCLIETSRAVANAEAATAVPRLGVLMFGTSDPAATWASGARLCTPRGARPMTKWAQHV